MPIDAQPAENGNVTLTGQEVPNKAGRLTPEVRVDSQPPLIDDGAERFLSHFATCPDAGRFRR